MPINIVTPQSLIILIVPVATVTSTISMVKLYDVTALFGIFLEKTNIKISWDLGALLSDNGVGERQGQKTCYYCKGPVMGIPPIAI